MNPLKRALVGRAVGLSISESDDSAHRGFPPWQVNRVTLQVVAALFGQGAGVVFGHDWREDGVMEAVHGLARQMQPPDPISRGEAAAAGHPLLQNLIPWPDTPHLSSDDLEQLASTLRVEEAGLPRELLPHDTQLRSAPRNGPLYAYTRARGLTHLRHRLDERCDARICIGGRRGGSQGRYPGIIEEALLTVQAEKPLYLVGLLGGATRQVIDAIEGNSIPEEFCTPTMLNELFASPPFIEHDIGSRADREVDRNRAWAAFRHSGIEQLSRFNALSRDENAELFHTPVLDRAIELILTGLGRQHSTATP